jgi:uncharacterized protein with ParB-like and HNH nuclease domain
MQVGTLAIQHLFEKDVLYKVPLYQRPYVWNQEEQWAPLWEDLRRLAEQLLAGKQPRAHFLGASVQDRPPMPPGQIETRLLIDGQQRLTTVQLFLRAFEDVSRSDEDTSYQQALAKLTRNNHPLSKQPHERFKVWPTNADQEDFEKVMQAGGRTVLLSSYGVRANTKSLGRNIPDAYLFFWDQISAWLGEFESGPRPLKIPALYSAIRENVRLVVIDLDDKDDAQLIFETLNARGTPLLSADLVKNSLLNEVLKDGGDVESAYKKYWLTFDNDMAFWRKQVGKGHAKRARIETFLQHALTLMTKDEVSAGHLYTAYRDYSTSESAGSPIDRLETFRKYGEIYKQFHGEQSNPRISLFLERLETMDFGSVYPLLLRLFDALASEDDTLVDTLGVLESFLVRRMICRLSTRGYARLFVDIANRLDTTTNSIPAELQSILREGTAEIDRWPNDEELKRAWLEYPLYENLTRPRVRLLLEAMEMALRSDLSETKSVPRNLTIEHIMPQTWEQYWPLAPDVLVVEATQRRNQLIHTVGNLTLLNHKLNPKQSNKPWIDSADGLNGKRGALNEHSVLYLNKELVDHETWDESKIQLRGMELFSLAKATWPGPS